MIAILGTKYIIRVVKVKNGARTLSFFHPCARLDRIFSMRAVEEGSLQCAECGHAQTICTCMFMKHPMCQK